MTRSIPPIALMLLTLQALPSAHAGEQTIWEEVAEVLDEVPGPGSELGDVVRDGPPGEAGKIIAACLTMKGGEVHVSLSGCRPCPPRTVNAVIPLPQGVQGPAEETWGLLMAVLPVPPLFCP